MSLLPVLDAREGGIIRWLHAFTGQDDDWLSLFSVQNDADARRERTQHIGVSAPMTEEEEEEVVHVPKVKKRKTSKNSEPPRARTPPLARKPFGAVDRPVAAVAAREPEVPIGARVDPRKALALAPEPAVPIRARVPPQKARTLEPAVPIRARVLPRKALTPEPSVPIRARVPAPRAALEPAPQEKALS